MKSLYEQSEELISNITTYQSNIISLMVNLFKKYKVIDFDPKHWLEGVDTIPDDDFDFLNPILKFNKKWIYRKIGYYKDHKTYIRFSIFMNFSVTFPEIDKEIVFIIYNLGDDYYQVNIYGFKELRTSVILDQKSEIKKFFKELIELLNNN